MARQAVEAHECPRVGLRPRHDQLASLRKVPHTAYLARAIRGLLGCRGVSRLGDPRGVHAATSPTLTEPVVEVSSCRPGGSVGPTPGGETFGPFSRQAAQLTDIGGVNTVAAAELIDETAIFDSTMLRKNRLRSPLTANRCRRSC